MRRTLQRRLAAQDVSAEEAYDIVFASHEAAANMVEHAYGLESGQIELRCRAHEDAVHVTLADRGRWRPPRGEGRGRGVGLMHVTAPVYGDLDLANRHDVEQALRESVPADVATLVLDLTHVGFLDSSAVQMLFELHRDMERARGWCWR